MSHIPVATHTFRFIMVIFLAYGDHNRTFLYIFHLTFSAVYEIMIMKYMLFFVRQKNNVEIIPVLFCGLIKWMCKLEQVYTNKKEYMHNKGFLHSFAGKVDSGDEFTKDVSCLRKTESDIRGYVI